MSLVKAATGEAATGVWLFGRKT